MKRKIISIDPQAPDPKLISKAVKIIQNGGIVAFPSDTCYGLAVNPFDPQAVDRLFEIKGRDANKPVILLVSSILMLETLTTSLTPLSKSIMEEFWPGPLTLIFKKNRSVPNKLGGKDQSIAIRYPKAKIPIRLIKQADIPLTATSANRSGNPTASSAEEIKESIGDDIELILDAGTYEQLPSTILDITVTPPKILRKGKLSEKLLNRFLY